MTMTLDDLTLVAVEKVGIFALLVGAVSAFAKRLVVPRSAYDELKEDRDEWARLYRELADRTRVVHAVLQPPVDSDRRRP